MTSTEWTTKISTKVIDDGAIRLTVENYDSKATVIISIEDAKNLIGDLSDAIAGA